MTLYWLVLSPAVPVLVCVLQNKQNTLNVATGHIDYAYYKPEMPVTPFSSRKCAKNKIYIQEIFL